MSTEIELVKFTTWSAGYRAGDVAGFPPADAARLIAEKVAEPFLTEAERGKAEAVAKKAAEVAEKEATAAAEKAAKEAQAEEDRRKKEEADQKKAGGSR